MLSRTADHLYWMARYTERAENAVRLARLVLDLLGGEGQSSPPLLAWLHRLALRNALVPREVPSVAKSRRVFERAVIADLGKAEAGSVGYNLRCVRQAAAAVRDWARAERGVDSLVSVIAPANVASQRVAARLGAAPAETVALFDTDEAVVWRYPR